MTINTDPTLINFNLTRVQNELAKCNITSEIVSLATPALMVDLKVNATQVMIVDPQAMAELTGDVEDFKWSIQIMDFDEADLIAERHMLPGNTPRVVARAAIATFAEYVKTLSDRLEN